MRLENCILASASKTQDKGEKPSSVLQYNTRCLPPPFIIDIEIFSLLSQAIFY